ncbi:MAG: alkaline phosphatase [Flavobacteriaceae bacterium]|nr:MAG: alkaline phosphatase [Flavobacteriaceae bacterium]
MKQLNMITKKIRFALTAFFIFISLHAQDLINSGPMVGYSTMQEVLLWVQTSENAKVHFEYYEIDNPSIRFKTDEKITEKKTGFVAKLIADQVMPGKKYNYEIFINDIKVFRDYEMEFQTQQLWKWRTDPPDFKFVIGSCSYVNEPKFDRPGEPYGSNFEIFNSINKKNPDFMLWLGDNTYLRESDWNSRTGFIKRYSHTRALRELQPLLASTHHYATWDDHDYGPNNSDGSFWLKETASEIFKLFWTNPNYDVTGKGGITGLFQWSDVDFFLMDNRYHRTSNNNFTVDRQILGKDQIDWLINALTFSQATFKFIAMGGQVISSGAVYENYATYPEERKYLLDKIREAKIEGVIFLDGDRHHTVLSKMQESDEVYPLYDLTCSSLTAGVNDDDESYNIYSLKETLVGENNFGMLNVTGPASNRVLIIKIFDKDGQELWEKSISANDLKYN